MKALVLDAEARTAKVSDIAEPKPASHELLIRVGSIALNPIDPLYVAHPLGKTGRTIGSDSAGHVIGVGPDVPPFPDSKESISSLDFCKAHAVSTTDLVHLQNCSQSHMTWSGECQSVFA